jgi:hypothetical protein
MNIQNVLRGAISNHLRYLMRWAQRCIRATNRRHLRRCPYDHDLCNKITQELDVAGDDVAKMLPLLEGFELSLTAFLITTMADQLKSLDLDAHAVRLGPEKLVAIVPDETWVEMSWTAQLLRLLGVKGVLFQYRRFNEGWWFVQYEPSDREASQVLPVPIDRGEDLAMNLASALEARMQCK